MRPIPGSRDRVRAGRVVSDGDGFVLRIQRSRHRGAASRWFPAASRHPRSSTGRERNTHAATITPDSAAGAAIATRSTATATGDGPTCQSTSSVGPSTWATVGYCYKHARSASERTTRRQWPTITRERSPIDREQSPVDREQSPIDREQSPIVREWSTIVREWSAIIGEWSAIITECPSIGEWSTSFGQCPWATSRYRPNHASTAGERTISSEQSTSTCSFEL